MLRRDSDLPAVCNSTLSADALRQRFAHPPLWTPEHSAEPRLSSLPGNRPLAEAAVLLGLVQRPHGWTVLLTERASTLNTHSGQIALPGGRKDAGDMDAAATAFREAEEEIGLQRMDNQVHVTVLGTLPLYTTGSGFAITPVVALIEPQGNALLRLKADPAEVAAIFEVPLAFLMNPAHHRHHTADWDGHQRHWLSMPYQDESAGEERYIWGATAAILRNFYRFLSTAATSR